MLLIVLVGVLFAPVMLIVFKGFRAFGSTTIIPK